MLNGASTQNPRLEKGKSVALPERIRKLSLIDMTETAKMLKSRGSAKKLTREDFSASISKDDSIAAQTIDFEKVLKVVRESWEDVTELDMPSMIVLVPSDLED